MMKRVICWKSEIYLIPRVFDAPIGSDPPEFHQNLWHQKTRIPKLLYGLFAWR